jgi:hypothetical protein
MKTLVIDIGGTNVKLLATGRARPEPERPARTGLSGGML